LLADARPEALVDEGRCSDGGRRPLARGWRPRLFAVTWRVGPVPPASILVIVDAYEGTQSSIAVLS